LLPCFAERLRIIDWPQQQGQEGNKPNFERCTLRWSTLGN
jgi:hypothetical protein